MADPTSKIIKKLNEADACCGGTCLDDNVPSGIDLDNPPRNQYIFPGAASKRVSPELEPERTLGVFEPLRVMQCCNCASFYLEDETPQPCPKCDSEDVVVYGTIVPDEDDEEEDFEEEDAELELDLDLDESLNLLENHRLAEFNRKFGRKARVVGRNMYLVNEGLSSRKQRLTRDQLKSYNLSKYYRN